MTRREALTIDAGRGLVEQARQVPSPNQDARPPGASIDLIVVHGIGLPPGEFGGPWVEALFLNRLPAEVHPFFRTLEGLKVSAHVFVRRDGSMLQFVPFHARAWHAGASSWRHRTACNDFSVGIELEGADEVPYEPVQYEVLAQLVAVLRLTYPTLARDAIVGHSEVAPGRKTDPGPGFDWSQLGRLPAGRTP
jgi:N-acetyl-anhydromuramoyl-L-alanine amidase